MQSQLITLPNKELRKRSQRIIIIDKSIHKLVADMEKATLDWEESRDHEVGVALAAVQINVRKRVIIIRSDFNNKEDKTFRVFINPKIAKYEGEVVEDFEGCLSVKDIYGKVPRYSIVHVDAKDINNNDVRITAKDFLARVFQHEIDHINGKVFVDRIQNNPEAFYKLGADGKIEELKADEKEAFFSVFW
jgi:peptide deformylase